MNLDNFTHLHLHTCYSLGSGTIKIDDLIKTALKNNIKSLSLTDHLNIFGAIKFYNKCIASNVKPIIGCEIPVFSNDSKKLGNIVLLCQNINGYHNLNKILSFIHTSRSSYLGADLDILKKYNSDLICLSGGRNGLCGVNILNKPLTIIKETLKYISKIYQSKFYIEIDRTHRSN
jgi:DNA polymerase-3 subunit alpha